MPRSRSRVGVTNRPGEERSQKRLNTVFVPPGTKPESGEAAEDKPKKANLSPLRSSPTKRSPLAYGEWALLTTHHPHDAEALPSCTRTYSYGDPSEPAHSAPKYATEDGLKYNLAALRRCRHKLTVHQGGVKKYFQSWCKDGKGNLSRDDMAAGFKELNLGFNEEENNFLVRVFDKDRSNTIEYSEFCKTMELTEAEVVKAVMTNTRIEIPRWMRPALREEMTHRLHLAYGSEPQGIRKAFLSMDRDRVGLLSKEDMQIAMANIGMRIEGPDMDLLMSYYDNSKREGGVSYRTFIKHFEPDPVGVYNPFDPNHPVSPQQKVHATDEGEERRWGNAFGRDRRYKNIFPRLYHSELRPESCPPDFSWRPDVVDFGPWREQGKVVGKAFRTLDPRKTLPTRGQTAAANRFRRSMSTLPDARVDGAEEGARLRVSTGSMPSGAERVSQAKMQSKEQLLEERTRRINRKRQQAASAYPPAPSPTKPIEWGLG